jgi:UTP--glucose-1-phosphate uridylyltransferase
MSPQLAPRALISGIGSCYYAAPMADRFAIDNDVRIELERFGFDQGQLTRFAARANETVDNFVTGTITPVSGADVGVVPARGTPEHGALVARGEAAIRAGEVGVIVLAGGMATRFGGVVKAAVPVVNGRSFLALKYGDVRKLGEELDATIPTYVMTSYATHDRIVSQVREEALEKSERAKIVAFPQLVSVRLTSGWRAVPR